MNNEATQNQTSLLTVKQLLARIPVCRRTIENWKARGLIPYIKVGKCCLFDWDRVRAALQSHEVVGQIASDASGATTTLNT